MRVCLDARCLRKTVTGLGRYAEQLIRGLAAIDNETDYVVLLGHDYDGVPAEQENFRTVRMEGRPDTLGSVLWGARQIERVHADVYHSLHHFLPLGIQGKALLTLHDLIWIEHPELSYPNRLRGKVIQGYARLALKYALGRADHVIAISEHTARRAQQRMNTPATKMTIIPHGVDERFHQAGSAKDDSIRSNEPPFFLVLGNSKPNKNVARIVGATALLSERIPEIRLRIVGRGEGYADLRRQAATLGVADRVDFHGNVPDAELLEVFQRAIALVFPSLVEGFGMPILEAQAIGCPVITSDRGVLPETGGNAALYVNPYDSWDIARAMETLYRNPALRESLSQKGRERASRFTWETAARTTKQVYDRIMNQLPPEPEYSRQPVLSAAASAA